MPFNTSINFTTLATSSLGTQWNGSHPEAYERCQACFRNTSSAVQVGTNWIAAEVHAAWTWRRLSAFDLALSRNVSVPCSVIPGSPARCVRQVNQTIFKTNSLWQFSDARLPLPPSDWMMSSFNATSWLSGTHFNLRIGFFTASGCLHILAKPQNRGTGKTAVMYMRRNCTYCRSESN